MLWPWDWFRVVEMVAGGLTIAFSAVTWTRAVPLTRRLRFLTLAGFAAVTSATAFDRFGEVPNLTYRPFIDTTLMIAAAVATVAYYWEPRLEPAPRPEDIKKIT